MISIYINCELFTLMTKTATFSDIAEAYNYLITNDTVIVDELTRITYKYNDTIDLRNGLSLIIYEDEG